MRVLGFITCKLLLTDGFIISYPWFGVSHSCHNIDTLLGPSQGFGELGRNAIYFQRAGEQVLILRNWGALSECQGVGVDSCPDPTLYISILLFHSILVPQNDYELPFRLAPASIPDSISAKDQKSFPKNVREHALIFLGS